MEGRGNERSNCRPDARPVIETDAAHPGQPGDAGGRVEVGPLPRHDREELSRAAPSETAENGRQANARAAVHRPRVLAGDYQEFSSTPPQLGQRCSGYASRNSRWKHTCPADVQRVADADVEPGEGDLVEGLRGMSLLRCRRPEEPAAVRGPTVTEEWQPTTEPLVLHVIPTTVARGAQREARALAIGWMHPGSGPIECSVSSTARRRSPPTSHSV